MKTPSDADFTLQLRQFFDRAEEGEDQLPSEKLTKPGDQCPACRQGKLEYDGMLNLVCTICGKSSRSSGGACT